MLGDRGALHTRREGRLRIPTLFSATDRYIARLIIVPLVSSLLVAAMLLVLDRMLRLFDFVAAEGGPVSVVWRMLANLLPEYLSLGIPIGVLLGILLAFRKLAISSELDVLLAVGQSYWRLLRVPLMFAIAFALLNLAIVGFIQPWSRYAYEELRFDLRSGALGASIKVGEFTRLGKDMTLRIEASSDRGRELSGIFVNAREPGGRSLAVAAEYGTFMGTDDRNVIILRLQNGTLIHDAPDFRVPRVLTFERHDLPIDLPRIERFRARGIQDRESTLPQLFALGHDDKTEIVKRNEARSEFHFRMVQVAMMLMLPLLAVSLAVPPKRSTSGIGALLSIVMVVTYYKISEYAAEMGALGRLDPLPALWIPFILFAGLIAWMYYTLAFVPGGQPIGGLERSLGKALRTVRKLFGRRAASV